MADTYARLMKRMETQNRAQFTFNGNRYWISRIGRPPRRRLVAKRNGERISFRDLEKAATLKDRRAAAQLDREKEQQG